MVRTTLERFAHDSRALAALVATTRADATSSHRAALRDELRAWLESLAREGGLARSLELGPDRWALFVARAPHRRWYALGESSEPLPFASVDELRGAVLRTCGPPWAYLRSALPEGEPALTASYANLGFAPSARHLDLLLALPPREAPSVEERGPTALRTLRADEAEPALRWIEQTFAAAWRREAALALEVDGLLVAERAGALVGFVAHSAHDRRAGTFGPLGVLDTERRTGLGLRLARAALAELARRGHTSAVVPWIDPALERFYARSATVLEVTPRAVLERVQPEGASRERAP